MRFTERAPYKLTLVVETEDKLFFGSYDSTLGNQLLLRDGVIQPIHGDVDPQRLIRKVVRGGVTPENAFMAIPSADVLRIRRLEEL